MKWDRRDVWFCLFPRAIALTHHEVKFFGMQKMPCYNCIQCVPINSKQISLFQALSGFLMMMTQNGKLLYISDNAAEYLGHSMVSVLKVSELWA